MKSRQHTQQISIKLASEITNEAIKNSKSLYEDAKLLFENERYARSIALAILSIEESGKPSIIRSIILEDDAKEIAKLWKSFRNHHEKNTMWIVPGLIMDGATTLEEMRRVLDPDSDHPKTLENLKQLCFYTDVFSKGMVSLPDNVANKEIAYMILKIAETSKTTPLTSEEHLEVWVKHMKPVWKREMTLMKKGLLECYKELERKKLIEEGMSIEMMNFLK